MKKLLGLAAFTLLLAPAARATWSVVVVNTKTREVCVAGATCIPSIGLKNKLAVVVVGKGGAAAQSQIDNSGQNRAYIWNGLLGGTPPAQIIQELALLDGNHQTRQYGIVSMTEPPATFTGSLAGLARIGVTGEDGDVRYSIQGNVLAGDAVVTAAEIALLTTPGDLSQRALAAMEAARALGGDGRCSCQTGAPDSCGTPPPNFVYSSYTSFFVLARMGDSDGNCGPGTNGCANGTYFCDLRAISFSGGPEPVELLERKYDAWRHDKLGIADHLLSRVEASAQRLVADGVSSLTVDVQLNDIDGNPVTDPANQLHVAATTGDSASVGTVTNHGGGHYSFPVVASTHSGTFTLQFSVTYQALDAILLWPRLEIQVDALSELHSGFHSVSATSGALVPFTLNLGAAHASAGYHVLGSASGTVPGIVFQGQAVPLNCDTLLRASVGQANNLRFQGTLGVLDASGRAEARFVASPGLMQFYVGRRMDWAAVLPNHVTNVVGFGIVP
ncbi:MAG: DUF1028 domain-containing protein [Planctomycetota bacterium]